MILGCAVWAQSADGKADDRTVMPVGYVQAGLPYDHSMELSVRKGIYMWITTNDGYALLTIDQEMDSFL